MVLVLLLQTLALRFLLDEMVSGCEAFVRTDGLRVIVREAIRRSKSLGTKVMT